jgi:hypothetical protein
MNNTNMVTCYSRNISSGWEANGDLNNLGVIKVLYTKCRRSAYYPSCQLVETKEMHLLNKYGFVHFYENATL